MIFPFINKTFDKLLDTSVRSVKSLPSPLELRHSAKQWKKCLRHVDQILSEWMPTCLIKEILTFLHIPNSLIYHFLTKDAIRSSDFAFYYYWTKWVKMLDVLTLRDIFESTSPHFPSQQLWKNVVYDRRTRRWTVHISEANWLQLHIPRKKRDLSHSAIIFSGNELKHVDRAMLEKTAFHTFFFD
jgi:hypothetical protein